jgi:F-type H+-transporting ATPase subunit a
VSLIVLVFTTQLSDFFAHLIPFGAPMFLSFLLPLVELFRQLIRPLTLIIRLSTNLSAGHIILYMFSYFSLSSNILGITIFWLLLFLIILEVRISLLQAYIFTSLSYLYMSETL